MKSQFFLTAILLSVIIFTYACNDKITPPSPDTEPTDTLTYLGQRGFIVIDIEYENPFLYVCMGTKGVWKKNVDLNNEWQYLGLGDTSLSHSSRRGALNIDVHENSILVAYSEPGDTCRPDQCVGIWGSSDGGLNWFRSDNGIPESIVDTFEHNSIFDLERSPFNPNNVFAIYGPATYVSKNNGDSWLLYGIRGAGANEDNVRWNPFRENELWVFGHGSTFQGYLAVSRTGGVSFEFGVDLVQLGFGSTSSVSEIAFDKENGLIIYVLVNGTLIKSTDGGESWITSGFDIPGGELATEIIEDKNNVGVIYLSRNNKLYYSKEGGSNINLLIELPFESIITFDMDESKNKLFIGTNDGIYSYNLNTVD